MYRYNKGKDKYSILKFIDPITNHNNRLISQSGIFTKIPLGLDIEKWVKEEFNGLIDRPIMFKILIPDNNREEILKELMMMNINHMVLFPDLIGASKYCNIQMKTLSHTTKK